MVGWHVEGPLVGFDLQAGGFAGHEEGGDANGGAGFAGGACEDEAVGCGVHAGLPFLVAVDFEAVFARGQFDGARGGVHVCGVGAVMDLGEPEGGAEFTLGRGRDELFFLLFGAVVMEHYHNWIVADDGVLVLQVVGETDAAAVDRMRGQMVADSAHVDVGLFVFLSTKLLGVGEAVEASFVRELFGLHEDILPVVGREATFCPVRSRSFSPMIKEAVVVIFMLEW